MYFSFMKINKPIFNVQRCLWKIGDDIVYKQIIFLALGLMMHVASSSQFCCAVQGMCDGCFIYAQLKTADN